MKLTSKKITSLELQETEIYKIAQEKLLSSTLTIRLSGRYLDIINPLGKVIIILMETFHVHCILKNGLHECLLIILQFQMNPQMRP